MYLERIVGNDEIREELLAKLRAGENVRGVDALQVDRGALEHDVRRVHEHKESASTVEHEAIVRLFGRPVLFVRGGAFELPACGLWHKRLELAAPALRAVIPSVGRVELRHHPRLTWGGTAWRVADDVLVTNRHVAHLFARRGSDGIAFRANPEGQRMRAGVDFLAEIDSNRERMFRIREVLHLEPDDDGAPDLALLRVDEANQQEEPLPPPIALAATEPAADTPVAVVGYPAWDDRNDLDVMHRIFQGIYDVKRLQPGEIMDVTPEYFTHDCSTLGGNSGSVVLDLETGAAVGLHFAGSFQRRNYAVSSVTVGNRLADIGRA